MKNRKMDRMEEIGLVTHTPDVVAFISCSVPEPSVKFQSNWTVLTWSAGDQMLIESNQEIVRIVRALIH